MPILTDREDLEAELSDLDAELDELREAVTDSETTEAELSERIGTLQNALSVTESENAELEDEVARLQDDITDTEADDAARAAVISEQQASRAQFELYEDEVGEHRWRLRHRTDNVLAGDGQGYSHKSGMWDGIESMNRNGPNAAFEETEG